jgi:hypothetical protein
MISTETAKQNGKRPREVIVITSLGLPIAIFMFLIIPNVAFRIFIFAYAFTLFELFRLRKAARKIFIGFSIFFMLPFLLFFIMLIWSLITGQFSAHHGEVGMWLIGFSMLFSPIFLYHLIALRYLIRPQVKRQFNQ